MAILALHRGVSAEKREAILVILNLLNGIVPTKNRVTLRAIRAHLALVNIGMAILTILPHIREYRFYVALRALHFLVHAAQRIVRFGVIEFGDRANGAPARSGVTVLARNRERSVRTTRAALLTIRKRSACRRPRQKQQPQHDLNTFRRKCPTILLKYLLFLLIRPRKAGCCEPKIVLTVSILKEGCATVLRSSSGSGAKRTKTVIETERGHKYELHFKLHLPLAVPNRTNSCVSDVSAAERSRCSNARRGPAAEASQQLNKIESVRLAGDGDSTRATQRCLLTTHSCFRSSGRPIED